MEHEHTIIRETQVKLAGLQDLLKRFDFLQPLLVLTEELTQKINSTGLCIVITGEAKAGKSTIANSLLNRAIAPSSAAEDTLWIYIYHFGCSREYATVTGPDAPATELPDLSSLDEIPTSQPAVIDIYLADTSFPSGFLLIDTPSLSRLDLKLQQKYTRHFADADLILFPVDINQGVTSTIYQQLIEISHLHKESIVVLTKTDTKPQKEIDFLLAHTRKQLSGITSDIIPFSCKDNFSLLKIKVQALVAGQPTFAARSVQSGLQAIGKQAIGILDLALSEAGSDTGPLNARLLSNKDQLEDIKQGTKIILDKTEIDLGDVITSTIRVFETGLRQAETELLQTASDNIDALENVYNNRLAQVAAETSVHYQSGIKNAVSNLQNSFSGLINKQAPQFDGLLLDLPTPVTKFSLAALLPFFSQFLNTLPQHPAQLPGDTGNTNTPATFNKLVLLIRKGAQLISRIYITRQITSSLAQTKFSFIRAIREAETQVNLTIRSEVNTQVLQIENTLNEAVLNVQVEIKNQQQDHAAWLASVRQTSHDIQALIQPI